MAGCRDDQAMLAALLSATCPQGLHDAALAANPEPRTDFDRQRWRARQQRLVQRLLDMHDDGLIEEYVVPGERTGDRYVITATGWQALSATRRQARS